jgi:hypothetical protein
MIPDRREKSGRATPARTKGRRLMTNTQRPAELREAFVTDEEDGASDREQFGDVYARMVMAWPSVRLTLGLEKIDALRRLGSAVHPSAAGAGPGAVPADNQPG